MIEGFIYGKRFGQGVDVEIVGVFFWIICIGAVRIKDAHATEEGLMRATHAVEIVDGAVGGPGGEMGSRRGHGRCGCRRVSSVGGYRGGVAQASGSTRCHSRDTHWGRVPIRRY